VVRDGDLVGAYGSVVAVPGRPVRFCAPVAQPDSGTALGHERPPGYCEAGVTLLGADLGKLTQRRQQDGVVSGETWISGRFRAGTVTVTRQGAPPPRVPAADQQSFPDAPPCPAPPGGWLRTELDNDGVNRISEYLAANPDRYGDIVITYPDGPPSGPTDAPGYAKTQVALVGTVIDPATAERELRAFFGGNLCVARVPHSRTEVDAVFKRVDPLLERLAGLYETGPDYYGGKVRVELVVLDRPRYQALAAADAGTGIIAAQPWLAKPGR
jgi:hypothetical protein